MNRGLSRLLPLIAASAALHAFVLVTGPEALTVATSAAGSGHQVSIRLEAAAPAGAAPAAGPMGASASARPSPARRTQPPTPDPSTVARADRPMQDDAPEPSARERDATPIGGTGDRPARDATRPEPEKETGERLAETPMAEAGPDRASSEAERAQARAAIVAELARHFHYPRLARRHGWEGTVVLTVRILSDGRLSDIAVKHSSGRALLDRSAAAALEDIERLPQFAGRLGGGDLALEIPVIYRLESA